MITKKEMNYDQKREQAMLDVINQLDLKDNNHGIKDVIEVLAEFWNTAVKLAEHKALADENKKYIRNGQGHDGSGHYELFKKYGVD